MNQANFDALRTSLTTLPEAVSLLTAEMAVPHEGSRASLELAEAGAVIEAAITQTWIAIEVIQDHMGALERELTNPVMTYAPWSTTRVILESAAHSLWLSEDVDLRTRVARSLSLRLQHLDAEAVYVRDAIQRHPTVEAWTEALPRIETTRQHFVDQAVELNIREKRDKQGRLRGFGDGIPNITDLIDQHLGEGGMYRLYSAAAHNRTWALQTLGMRISTFEGKRVAEQYLATNMAIDLMANAIEWFARPTWAYFKLNGWDLDRLAAVFEQNYDKCRLRPETRFWR